MIPTEPSGKLCLVYCGDGICDCGMPAPVESVIAQAERIIIDRLNKANEGTGRRLVKLNIWWGPDANNRTVDDLVEMFMQSHERGTPVSAEEIDGNLLPDSHSSPVLSGTMPVPGAGFKYPGQRGDRLAHQLCRAYHGGCDCETTDPCQDWQDVADRAVAILGEPVPSQNMPSPASGDGTAEDRQ